MGQLRRLYAFLFPTMKETNSGGQGPWPAYSFMVLRTAQWANVTRTDLQGGQRASDPYSHEQPLSLSLG